MLDSISRGFKQLTASPVPLALVALVAFAAYLFLQIAGAVGQGSIEAFDRAVLLAFRNPTDINDPIGPLWVEQVVGDLTTLGGTAVLVVLVATVAGFLYVARRPGPATYIVVSIALGTLFSQWLKVVYARPRPDVVEHLVTIQTASFPSGHATMSMIVYLTLAVLVAGLVNRVALRVYVVTVALLISGIVGVSRIYLGVHWPSDVAAGWALGIGWACLALLVLAGLRRIDRGPDDGS